MFDYQGPCHAHDIQREFVGEFSAAIDAGLKEKLVTANRAVSPVEAITAGMEALYVIARKKPPATVAGKKATLNALGISATACGHGQFGGAEAAKRAWAIQAWAAHQVSPVGPAPPAPAVSPAYTTVAPAPVATGPAPVA